MKTYRIRNGYGTEIDKVLADGPEEALARWAANHDVSSEKLRKAGWCATLILQKEDWDRIQSQGQFGSFVEYMTNRR